MSPKELSEFLGSSKAEFEEFAGYRQTVVTQMKAGCERLVNLCPEKVVVKDKTFRKFSNKALC